MSVTTYSFQDLNASISHPGVGQLSMNGEGLGNINFSRSNDATVHDVSSDGSVMVTKVIAKNGAIAISTQQSSELNAWLKKWYNYAETAPSSEWAKGVIIARHTTLGDNVECTGVSFQKTADVPYQAQGQQITWNLMAAEIAFK